MNQKLRLGGMALRNGLLVHGPHHWVAAVRAEDASILVASGPKPRLSALDGLPGLRGLARLAEAMILLPLIKRSLPQAQLPFESPAIAGVIGATALATAAVRRRAGGRLGGEALAAALGVAPALLALRSGELAAYHGVEHKAIGAYESDQPDAAQAAKEHDRCGSHLMAPMLAANLAGVALLRRVLPTPGPLAGSAVALASTGAAVEVFAWTERHSATPAARALRRPGHELQRLIGTREPSEGQLEVGRRALAEILALEADQDTGPSRAGGISRPEGTESTASNR